MPREHADYAVGYGKPPKHTRFKKGRSGNPRGRPRGAKNLSTLLFGALNEQGHCCREWRAPPKNQQARSHGQPDRQPLGPGRSQGDGLIVLGMLQEIERRIEPASSETFSFGEADQKVIEQLKMRFSKGEK